MAIDIKNEILRMIAATAWNGYILCKITHNIIQNTLANQYIFSYKTIILCIKLSSLLRYFLNSSPN